MSVSTAPSTAPTTLDSTQRQRAVEIMHDYLKAPAGPDGQTPKDKSAQIDRNRVALIDQTLRPLIMGYLSGTFPLAEFKTKIDGLNKRNRLWGFTGIKGQMFFNQLVNTATDLNECDHEIKAAIAAPSSEDIAQSRIRMFLSYVKRLGDEHVEKGGTGHGRPKTGSVPYFLSYFWQIQDRDRWPVYYTNSVQTAEDLNLWRPGDDQAENYVAHLKLYAELAALFSQESGQRFGIYDVEHVFWFKGGNPYAGATAASEREGQRTTITPALPIQIIDGKLPDSYVPPIVAVLPQMAVNAPELVEAAKASGTSLERAFEKGINAAFTILGYQTQLLGQGQGRVPDGRAADLDNSYVIIWDAKVRANGYSIGTDDRIIREYIKVQSRELKKKGGFRNIYYAIISGRFAEGDDDITSEIKMETDVNEVCLLQAMPLSRWSIRNCAHPTRSRSDPTACSGSLHLAAF